MKEFNKKISINSNKLENLIYVCGSARSGTTLLFNLLNTSNEIHKLPSMTHFYSNFIRNNFFLHYRLKQLIYKKMIPWFNVEKICLDNSLDFEIHNNEINKAIKNKNFKKLYKYYAYLSLVNKNYSQIRLNKINSWADKSNNWRGINSINKWFPKCKFILIMRNPKSVLASQLYRDKIDQQFINISDIQFIKFLEKWIFMNLKIINKSKKKNYKILFFENLINDTQGEIDSLFEFLNLNKITKKALSDFIENYQGKSIFKQSQNNENIDKNTINYWQKVLTTNQENFINIFISYKINENDIDNIIKTKTLFSYKFIKSLLLLDLTLIKKLQFYLKIFIIVFLYKAKIL